MMRLNARLRGMRPSATVAINERCAELRSAGRPVFLLGLGQSPFPIPDCVVDYLRSNAERKAYLPVRGLRELRDAIAAYHHRTQRLQGDCDDVLVGPGSKELMFLLQLAFDGCIVIPSPSWVSYAPQARILGRTVEWIETDADMHWRVDAEQLDATWAADPGRARVLVLNYPNNPTGLTYSSDELQALAAVARRHDAVVLSDEIYAELQYDGLHRSIAQYYPEGTIVSSGLSKWCGAGGWRLGTFLFPRRLRWLLDAMAAVASETYTAVSAPIQYAAVRAFQGGADIEGYLADARRILAALTRVCHAHLVAAGARVARPQGAFYLFVDWSPLADAFARIGVRHSEALCSRLLEETGVAVLPGIDFGRAPSELTLRIAAVDFDGAKATVAARAIPATEPLDDAFVVNYCAPVLDAVTRIADWVESIVR